MLSFSTSHLRWAVLATALSFGVMSLAAPAQATSHKEKVGLLVRLEAKPGQEAALQEFLQKALPLAKEESGTHSWYAIKISSGVFGIFDTFQEEAGRKAHLEGKIAKALGDNAATLLAKDPVIERVDIIAVK